VEDLAEDEEVIEEDVEVIEVDVEVVEEVEVEWVEEEEKPKLSSNPIDTKEFLLQKVKKICLLP
jgi:hypothetical protein